MREMKIARNHSRVIRSIHTMRTVRCGNLRPCHYLYGSFSLASSFLFLLIGSLTLFADIRSVELFLLWIFILLCQSLAYAACTLGENGRDCDFTELSAQSAFLTIAKKIQWFMMRFCGILFLIHVLIKL